MQNQPPKDGKTLIARIDRMLACVEAQMLSERQRDDIDQLRGQAIRFCQAGELDRAERIEDMIRSIVREGPPSREG